MDLSTPAGWLILHTEGKQTKAFDLKEGKNLIGRKTSSNNPDIAIEGDAFMSRRHAVVIVRRRHDSTYEYFVVDNAEYLGKPSLNGTFVNGNPQRIGNEPVQIKDGDTIQTGITKFVLKIAEPHINVEDAVKLTSKKAYVKTVEVPGSASVLRKIIK